MRILLHACCGPCSAGVLKRMSEEHQVTVYFYNPNIWPSDEYDRRLEAAKKIAEVLGIPFLEGDRDEDAWLEKMKGLSSEREGGSRCTLCYSYRLLGTALEAARQGFDAFTTTLSISPMKSTKKISECGEKAGAEAGIAFYSKDFKSMYRCSRQISEEKGLYRQHYCGCRFSVRH
jgi:epoxyqueuosine reductase